MVRIYAMMLCAICITFSAGCVSSSRFQAVQDELTTSREDNERATARIDTLETEVSAREKSISELEKALITMELQKNNAESTAQKLSGDLKNQQQDISRQRDIANEAQRRLTDAQATVKSLETEVQRQRAMAAEFKKERDDLAGKVEKLEQEIDALMLEIAELKAAE